MKSVLILACSPRADGNSDAFAEYFAQGVRQAGGIAQVLYLRQYHILPCTGCGYCLTHPEHHCVLAHKDDAEMLFAHMYGAALTLLTAPIFFYALPAGLKCFIDRAQRFWCADTDVPQTHASVMWAGLVGARLRGEQLFTGSMLCLKYFGAALGIRLTEHMLCYGYDGSTALRQDAARCAQITSWGGQAAMHNACVRG